MIHPKELFASGPIARASSLPQLPTTERSEAANAYPRASDLFMSMWTLEELQTAVALFPRSISKDEIKKRFDTVGGSLRAMIKEKTFKLLRKRQKNLIKTWDDSGHSLKSLLGLVLIATSETKIIQEK